VNLSPVDTFAGVKADANPQDLRTALLNSLSPNINGTVQRQRSVSFGVFSRRRDYCEAAFPGLLA